MTSLPAQHTEHVSKRYMGSLGKRLTFCLKKFVELFILVANVHC